MSLFARVVLPILIILLVVGGWTIYITSREVASVVKILNPPSEKARALLVWHPGQSDFPARVMNAFADGLIATGWRVDMTTASSEAPTDLAGYDMLVLGAPVYWGAPARPLSNYLQRIGDLRGKRTAIILTASGNSDGAIKSAKEKVAQAHGQIVTALSFYRWRPNREDATGDNETIGIEMARQAAQEIKPTTD